MKKTVCVVLALIMIFSLSITALASEDTLSEYIPILVAYGYTEETAEALPADIQERLAKKLLEDPDSVDIATLTLETDLLSEIEAFFLFSEEELIDMGADPDAVKRTKVELLSYYSMSNSELAKTLGIDTVEAALIKEAICSGQIHAGNKDYRNKKTGVSASGSITTSEMTYTQTAENNSTPTAPSYDVSITYAWKEVYSLAVFDDKIVAAWGGGLNSKNISSCARYYNWSTVGGSFGSYYTYKTMNKTETVQSALEFEFPQSVNNPNVINMPKTKSGYVNFTLYQTQKQGYDTKVLSNYCHKVISVGGGSISVDVSGPSVGLEIGYGYDTNVQYESTISY